MSDDLIFISYSRREFYFTESLVLYLQKNKINAWFDVQQLEPGIGWKTDIQDGLDQCKALVLVASQSSLASPYVKVEVQAAQQANKLVYIALFEPVSLPEELSQPFALIDFTQGFDRGIALLVSSIQQSNPHQDPLPPSSPPYLPAGVLLLSHLIRERVILWWILLGAALIVALRPLAYLLTQEYSTDPGFAPAILLFVPILTVWVLVVLFRNRHLVGAASRLRRREDMPFKYWVGVLYFRITAFIYFFFLTIAYTLAFKSALFLLLLLPAGYLLVTTIRGKPWQQWIKTIMEPDLLRWCHLGNEPPFDWRIIVNQSVLPDDLQVDVHSKIVKGLEDDNGPAAEFEVVTGVSVSVKGAKPAVKTFKLYDTPQIHEVAANIREILKKNAFQEARDPVAQPDYHILLLSPWMPIALAEQVMQQHPQNTLPILVAPANLTPLPHVTTLQLVDFRKRYEPQLSSALQYLHSQNAQQRSVFSISVLPVRLSDTFPLREIRPIQNMLMLLASLCFFLGIIGLVSLVFTSRIDLILGLRGLCYVACLGLAVRLRSAAHTVSNLVPQSPRSLLILILLTTLIGLGMFLAGLQPQSNVANASIGDQLAWRFFSSAFILILGVGMLLQVRHTFRRSLITSEPQPMLGLPAPAKQAAGAYIQLILFIIIGTVFAYISVVMAVGNISNDRLLANGSTIAIVVIAGALLALLVMGLVSGAVRSDQSQDDPVFAISDAPSLRYYLKNSLRKAPIAE
ncbi:MAG: toll/interleukin-1 receptor domain-containing protein [Anaerolineae bacterium]|nr:toll/interleukin-1 receptor domain-containing protein [Anaerolineae bacterium]